MLIFGMNPLVVAAAIRRRRQAACVAVLFLISGATGLVYQVIWTRRLILLFGTTAHAVSAVLAVYFVGLALGSLWGGRLADRTRIPLLWYGFFEMTIGAWAAGFLAFSNWSESVVAPLLRHVAAAPHAGIALRAGLALAFLAVPATLMGATLPLLARFAAGDERTRGMRIGALYSINTFGAVAGCAAAGFWLLPRFGYSGATWIAAGGNGLVGIAACWLGWGTLLPGNFAGTPGTPVTGNRRARYILV
ncbi:MAG TPA: fused MFS/spermidine synthase, partial [Candidatus Hydrogenedentes bacterium]|nr:fused MFS/spermidine synthase [Candidatus Hydrogenedentota bacterium]